MIKNKKNLKTNKMNELETVPVATRTIIADVNIQFDIETIFQKIPFRVKLGNSPCVIVAMYYKNITKGDSCVFQHRKCDTAFRNAVNIIFKIHNQMINVKVSTHGNFQITGCKVKENCYTAICYFLELCKKYCPDVILSQSSDSVSVIFYTVMTNIVFSAGFHIDKQKLNNLVVQNPMFYNLYETNFGYTGMNLKIPLVDTWRNFPIKKYSFNGDLSNWIVSELCFDTYFQENLKQKKKDKKRFNTFLVFHSGKIIMSGACEENMLEHYLYFKNFIREHRNEIEEKIEK
jgi:TATA-box binding protein (TBP) (component of TFIID and TFIIIB)